MQKTQVRTNPLGGTGMQISRVGLRGLGHWRRWLGVRLGTTAGRRVDRRDPPGPRPRRQLDRHGRRLRFRPRLGVDAIDLYQIHWPIPDEDIEEGWAAMAELKEQGLVRHIGVSNFTAGQLRRIRSIAPVETIQPPYSLIDRAAEADILPAAERDGIGVIVYSPMGSGLLTGAITRERIAAMPDDDWRKSDARFTEPQLRRHLALAARLQAVADRHHTTPGAVAVAWTLRNSAVDAAIVGFRRPAQVDPILAAAARELTNDDVTKIETEY